MNERKARERTELAEDIAALEAEAYSGVTRLEVINYAHGKGRVYSIRDDGIRVELSLQDDGRTLKVFIDKRHGT